MDTRGTLIAGKRKRGFWLAVYGCPHKRGSAQGLLYNNVERGSLLPGIYHATYVCTWMLYNRLAATISVCVANVVRFAMNGLKVVFNALGLCSRGGKDLDVLLVSSRRKR